MSHIRAQVQGRGYQTPAFASIDATPSWLTRVIPALSLACERNLGPVVLLLSPYLNLFAPPDAPSTSWLWAAAGWWAAARLVVVVVGGGWWRAPGAWWQSRSFFPGHQLIPATCS